MTTAAVRTDKHILKSVSHGYFSMCVADGNLRASESAALPGRLWRGDEWNMDDVRVLSMVPKHILCGRV